MVGVALAKYSFLYFNIFEDKREGRVQDPAYGGLFLEDVIVMVIVVIMAEE